MPSRNVVKALTSDSFYHIYNRAVSGQPIIIDQTDASIFLSMFKRHLSHNTQKDSSGRDYVNLRENIELLAYCIMPNHFHLLVYNIDEKGMIELMRRTMTAYVMNFNKRHSRSGALFQNTYKASLISSDAYLWHISRYIHLNPQDIGVDYRTYEYSSYPYYTHARQADWINTDRVLSLHNHNVSDYKRFVADYQSARKDLKRLKSQLADS